MPQTPARRRRQQEVQAQKLVDLLKAGADRRTLAKEIVKLRSLFEYEGMPDWGSNSPGYKDLIGRVYRDAGVPPDSGSSTQANLRYHIGNAIREVAAAEELAALGMDAAGPRERAVRARKEGPRAATRAPLTALPTANDPLAMAGFALQAVRSLRGMKPRGEMAEAVEAELRAVMDELVDTLAEVRPAARKHAASRL